jgi:hypothetical protein
MERATAGDHEVLRDDLDEIHGDWVGEEVLKVWDA